MDYESKYQNWLSFDEATAKELSLINDKSEIEDRFYKDLEFGTGGLRGIMGAGANRMNKYTVGRATLGLAHYLKSVNDKSTVVIAYDSRNNSKLFAQYASCVLTANKIKTYLFDTLMPTPVLSFAVKKLNCTAGIVITASHNPKEYNGYKIYDCNGCQLVPDIANKVISFVNEIDDYLSIPFMSLEEAKKLNLLEIIDVKLLDDFISEVKKQSLYNKDNDLKIVYTPLHGTGNIPVRKVLSDFNVSVVKEQEMPDGDFSTVRLPNPEEKDALTLAIKQGINENADIIIGTDPDCDRIGLAVKHNDEYILLTGNQTGALLVDFVLKFKKSHLNSKSTLVKTIVTNELGANIARSYGLNVVETLTGFKYIGNEINKYESTKEKEFIIGYEESYGYLVGTHSRDKDAVVASLLISEMASYYKNNNKTLVDVLNEIYNQYGYYLDHLDSYVLKGKEGTAKINSIMINFRNNANKIFNDLQSVNDYSLGLNSLPKENVLKFIFNNGSWIAIRPSGTEPKLKVYYSIKEQTKSLAKEKLSEIQKIVNSVINS